MNGTPTTKLNRTLVVIATAHKPTHWRLLGVALAISLGVVFGFAYRSIPEPPPRPTPPPTLTPLKSALAHQYWGATVTIGGDWSDSFAEVYERSFQDFATKTGIHIKYQVVDYEAPEFAISVEAGTEPDLLQVASPGVIRPYAKAGKIVDVAKVVNVDTLRARYDQNWLDWSTMDGPDGPIVGGVWGAIFLDNLVWYPEVSLRSSWIPSAYYLARTAHIV